MINFAGIEFKGLKKNELLKLNPDELKFVATLNAEFIVLANENKEFKQLLKNAICTFDGQIPYLLARFKNPREKFEKISGSDFIYSASEYAQKNKQKLFLLGGMEKSNIMAVEKLKEKYPGLEVAGYSPRFSPYPFSHEIEEEINEKITKFKPDILFVGFGAQKQERYIIDHKEFLTKNNVKLAIGSGGTFEFVSGVLPRAPKFFQVMGLEGVFRLLVEPKFFRLMRLIKSLKIFKYVF